MAFPLLNKILKSVSDAKASAKDKGKFFDLSKYIKKYGLSPDLCSWLELKHLPPSFEEELDSENSGTDSSNLISLSGIFSNKPSEYTAVQLIEEIVKGCSLQHLVLPLFAEIKYYDCKIEECSFKLVDVKCNALRLYNCTLAGVSIDQSYKISTLYIVDSESHRVYIRNCKLDEIIISQSRLKEFEISDCHINKTYIHDVQFDTNSVFKNNEFTLEFTVFKTTHLNMDDSNLFKRLHAVKNIGCNALDLYLNNKKLADARSNKSSVITIPYSMNGDTANADKLLKFFIGRGGYGSAEELRMLTYIIYINNNAVFDDDCKRYLDSSDLCVLPGGSNIPDVYYTEWEKGLLKDETFDMSLLEDYPQRYSDARTNSELKILHYMKDKTDIKLTGVCRGMQLMAVFCGASIINCEDTHSHNPGTHYMSISLESDQKTPLLTLYNQKKDKKNYFKPIVNTEDNTYDVKVSCQHSQQVSPINLPRNIIPLATRAGSPEAIAFDFNEQWYGTQNHPEDIATSEEDTYDRSVSQAIIRRTMLPDKAKKKRGGECNLQG